MGDADTTVDGESCGQILIKAVEPRPVHFIHQLSHPNHLWRKKDLKKARRKEGGRKGVRKGRWDVEGRGQQVEEGEQ